MSFLSRFSTAGIGSTRKMSTVATFDLNSLAIKKWINVLLLTEQVKIIERGSTGGSVKLHLNEKSLTNLHKLIQDVQDGNISVADVNIPSQEALVAFKSSTSSEYSPIPITSEFISKAAFALLQTKLTTLYSVLLSLIKSAADRAENEVDILMPGYTHLQPAQPVRFSHWLLSHVWSWQRDADRLKDLLKRLEDIQSSSAGEGIPLSLNNSDLLLEALSWSSMVSVHLSRFAEDMIIYSSLEFGFIRLSDAYSTGSSLMPQKKNPDALELLRGKAGRVVGYHTNGLVAISALSGIQRTHSTKNFDASIIVFEPVLEAVETLSATLPITLGVLSTLHPNAENMKKGLAPEMLATDLADYLVRKGVPFRETHHVAGAAVRLAEKTNRKLDQLTVEDLATLHPLFTQDVEKVWSFQNSVDSRNSEGGTSRRAVLEQVEKLRTWLSNA